MSSPTTVAPSDHEANDSSILNNYINELNDSTAKIQPSFNPSVSDDEDSDLNNKALRGDAIGDTLYSQRFVLSTLLKLRLLDKDLSENEEFERNLCDIWDMTVSKDVVVFLCDAKVIEIFIDIIKVTEDKRLIEILVGIIGNLCSVDAGFDDLWQKSESIKELLSLLSCRDSPTLIQLLRWMAVMTLRLKDNTSIKKWYEHLLTLPTFVDDLSFILYNSNMELLLHEAFRSMDAILSKLAVVDLEACTKEESANIETMRCITLLCKIFATSELIHGSIEAFTTLSSMQSAKNSIQSFLNIHSILSQYDMAKYKPYIERLLKCFASILKELNAESVNVANDTLVYNMDILDTMNDIFENLKDPFDKICYIRFLSIWKTIQADKKKHSEKSKEAANEFEIDDIDESIDYDEYLSLVNDFIKRQTLSATEDNIKQVLNEATRGVIQDFIKSFDADSIAKDFKICCDKLEKIMGAT